MSEDLGGLSSGDYCILQMLLLSPQGLSHMLRRLFSSGEQDFGREVHSSMTKIRLLTSSELPNQRR